MKKSISFYSILFAAILLSNCQNKNCDRCCNQAEKILIDDAEETNKTTSRNSVGSDNTDIDKRPSASTGQQNVVSANRPENTEVKGDPENSGNGDGSNSQGMSSSGNNIGNNGTSEPNTYKGGTGSTNSPGSRGNSGQGRPY